MKYADWVPFGLSDLMSCRPSYLRPLLLRTFDRNKSHGWPGDRFTSRPSWALAAIGAIGSYVLFGDIALFQLLNEVVEKVAAFLQLPCAHKVARF